jgi:hypothetical protein
MSHWCEMPAPRWAKKLAAEAIRERDCVPCALYPPTPREEDGSRDDLVCWLRAAERFLEAVKVGWISKKEWLYWCRVFESIPVVDAHFSALLPEALRARRLRREYAKARAAEREELDLAKALGPVPADPGGKRVFSGALRRRQDDYARVTPPRPVRSSVRRGARVLPECRY